MIIKDIFGDDIEVDVRRGNVTLDTNINDDSVTGVTFMEYKPKQARDLALALLMAANEAELKK